MDTNGWSSYEKLVLRSLDDLKAEQREQRQSLVGLSTNVALLAETVKKSADFDERITRLEANVVTSDEVKKEKRWLLGAALALVGSVVIPTLLVLASTGAL